MKRRSSLDSKDLPEPDQKDRKFCNFKTIFHIQWKDLNWQARLSQIVEEFLNLISICVKVS